MRYDHELKHVASAYRGLSSLAPTVNIGQHSSATVQQALTLAWEEIFKYGTLEDIAPLVEQHPAIVNWTNLDGQTPLHLVCWTNDDPDAIYFLAKISDVNSFDKRSFRPVDYLKLNKWFITIPDTEGNLRMQKLIHLDTQKILVDALIAKPE